MTISWPLSRQQVLDDSGRPLLVPRVNFYAGGTTDPITVYKDAARTQPWPQPVVADGFGRFPRVYLPEGLYREEVLGAYGELLWNDDGLGEAVAEDETEVEVPIDQDAIPRTGDIKWRIDASIQPGWVRMNERTVGAEGSGATELAGASAKALFVYLWSTFGESIASVVGGRGVTAAGDFAAGKAITVPSMRGLAAAGLDDMGSSPVGRLQTLANLALTAGSITATVSNASRLVLGMAVIAPGISAGTLITGISGTTITLSQPAASGSTGTVAGRFSLIGDAQMPGQSGGDAIAGLVVAQLPPFTPSGTIDAVDDHVHPLKYRALGIYATNAASGGVESINQANVNNSTTTTDPAGGHSHPFHGDPIGGGQAHPNLQPTRLGTFYMKL